MRIHVASIFVIGLVTGLAACSGSVAQGPGDDAAEPIDAAKPPPPPPPPEDAGVIPTDAGGPLLPPERGFQIISPTVEIEPRAELTFCFYFRIRNTSELAIYKWVSRMTAGTRDMIVYLTPTQLQTPGTLETRNCGFGANGAAIPVWAYSAQTPDAEAVLPPDDGTGKPVAQLIPSGQLGFIQMHYVNTSDQVIREHVELNAYAYAEGVQVTAAAPFVTYDTQIALQPGSTLVPRPGTATRTCTVAPGAKFFSMSTHTHKQSIHTAVTDGDAASTTTVFDSTDWARPGARTWNAAPFFSFASGKLTYRCDYMNPTNRLIVTGDSAVDNETCMAIGFFFPATTSKGHFCLDGSQHY
jgi:hypothetical protein